MWTLEASARSLTSWELLAGRPNVCADRVVRVPSANRRLDSASRSEAARRAARSAAHPNAIVYRALVEGFFASVAGKSSRALRKSRARARRVDRALERREAPLQWPRRSRVAVFQHAAARLLVGLAVPTAELSTPELVFGAFGCAGRLRYVVLARDDHSRRRARRAAVRISIDAPWRRPGCRFMPPGRRSDVGSVWRRQRRSSLAPRARGVVEPHFERKPGSVRAAQATRRRVSSRFEFVPMAARPPAATGIRP